jgi:hypothetical protein
MVVAIVFIQCDATREPPPVVQITPTIRSFIVEPNKVSFDKDTDGFKDTTLTFDIRLTVDNDINDFSYTYTIFDRVTNEILHRGNLQNSSPEIYADAFDIETSTTAFLDYLVEVYVFEDDGNLIYAQSNIDINGFANAAPQIRFADNPEVVLLPNEGTETVTFKAKVTDDDGQNTIDGVFLRLISRTSGEVSGSPFPLLDNGTQEDEIAADSVFTTSFNINSSNQPETYDILYYAKDLGGLVSDTVRTTFRISSN